MYKRKRCLEDINLEEAREFLEQIYRIANGNILIFILDKSIVLDNSKGTKDNVVQRYTVDDITSIDFAEIAEYNNQGYDIYYGINTRRGSGNTKDDVLEVSEFFVDVDAKDFEGGIVKALSVLKNVIVQRNNNEHRTHRQSR